MSVFEGLLFFEDKLLIEYENIVLNWRLFDSVKTLSSALDHALKGLFI